MSTSFSKIDQGRINLGHHYFYNKDIKSLYLTDNYLGSSQIFRNKENSPTHVDFAPEILSEAMLHAPEIQISHFAIHI